MFEYVQVLIPSYIIKVDYVVNKLCEPFLALSEISKTKIVMSISRLILAKGSPLYKIYIVFKRI